MQDMDIINFMIESFVQENRDLCERSGMTPEAIDTAMEQSQGSIEYMFKNLYFKMKAEGLINQS
jgi:hypothetical protein